MHNSLPTLKIPIGDTPATGHSYVIEVNGAVPQNDMNAMYHCYYNLEDY